MKYCIIVMYWPIIIGTLKFSKLMSINFLKRLVRKFDKRSEHFPLGDHFSNSHNHFPWLCIDFVGRKLMLVNFGAWNFKHSFVNSLSYLPSLRRPLCELYFSHVTSYENIYRFFCIKEILQGSSSLLQGSIASLCWRKYSRTQSSRKLRLPYCKNLRIITEG